MRKTIFILAVILLIGLFFRTYRLVERFGFGHDADLYSWIVKDIVIEKHIRLVGQITSTDGIFIGPLFYYSLIPFYLLFNMNPIGSAYFTVVIAIFTIVSYYFVFSKIFNRLVGTVAAFLHAVSWSTIGYDRWMVPTITTKLWAIWYLYTLIQITRGNFKILPLLAILIALIWHIHLALLPTLLAVPAAFVIAKKKPYFKQIIISFATFIVASIPLILFEVKHNFIQLKSLFGVFFVKQEGGEGWYKFQVVIDKISENTSTFLLAPISLPEIIKIPLTIAVLLSAFWLIKTRVCKFKEVIVLFTWIFGVVAYFSLSSMIVSEYYFTNLEIIFMLIVALIFYGIFKSNIFGKYLVFSILTLLLIRNFYLYVTANPYHVGYVERKAIAEYITSDAKQKNFPCVGINYITLPGENVGFRYLFYLNNLKLAPPSDKVPVYSIVFPYEWSKGEVSRSFGHMGVIPPAKIPPKESLEYDCSGANTNLTDPMFGFVQ